MATLQTTTKRISKTDRVKDLLVKRPDLSVKLIAKRVGVHSTLVYDVRKKMMDASKGAKLPDIAKRITIGKSRKAEVKPQVKEDIIPKYSENYTKAVDLIGEYKLNFNLGSAVAHIFRANSDNKRADIKAAIWYLSNELLATNL